MISLLYCGNNKIFKGLLISVVSIAKNTKEPLDVHIMTMDLQNKNPSFIPLSKDSAEYIETVIKLENSESRVTLHDATELFLSEMEDSPNMDSFYTPYSLLRLFSDKIEDFPDRVIYLDTDTVAKGDIAPLFNFDLRGCEFAGTRDYLGKFFINPRYINSGVLVLDIKKIRETGFFQKVRGFCATKKTHFPDQDAINSVAKKKRFFPRCYNEQRRMKKGTVIRHFSKTLRLFPYFHTLNIKPWDIDKIHEKYKTYDFDEVIYECLSLAKSFENETEKI